MTTLNAPLWVPPSAGNAERFGTVQTHENGWALVVPFNDEMAQRAIKAGAQIDSPGSEAK